MATLRARLAKRIGGYDWFMRVIPVIVPFDRLVARLTRGRFVSFGVEDLPSLLLTTTGRSSGQARTTPVFFVRDGENFVVSASNFGRPHHPAWSANLLAHPDAEVNVGGQVLAVRAQLAEGAERDRLIALLVAVWPHYPRYFARAAEAGRSVRIFRLDRRP